ncbi:conserved hypothetical protein [Candidatus Zixiibacteriota bacterium]|nr:conserved hypothetical protein [candidate division Zixibacteria bacterium]
MPISDELMSIIVCPKCKGALKYAEDRDSLNCENCRLIFSIDDGIPILLIDEAENY